MAQFDVNYRTLLIAFLILIVVAALLVYLMLVATIFYLLFPFLIVIILHYVKIWKTRQRLMIGTLVLVIGAVLMMAILTPVITSETMNALSTPTFSSNSSDNSTNITVTPYISNTAQSFTVTYTSNLSSNAKFNVSELPSIDKAPVHLFNITVAYSSYSNKNYTFSLVLNNLTAYMNKDLLEINVTQNSTYTVLFGPILLSKSAFENMISTVSFSDYILPSSMYFFIFAEVLYVLLVFVANMIRRGRFGFGRRGVPPPTPLEAPPPPNTPPPT
jgi:hypothetical protein